MQMASRQIVEPVMAWFGSVGEKTRGQQPEAMTDGQ
jgi:hypothetical protein